MEREKEPLLQLMIDDILKVKIIYLVGWFVLVPFIKIQWNRMEA